MMRSIARSIPGAAGRICPANARWVVLPCLLAALLSLSPATTDASEIRLRPEVRCTQPLVTLGDVADVLATDPEEAGELAAVELLPAPPPGRKYYLRAREIQDLLVTRGINLLVHRLSGASQTVISFEPEVPAPEVEIEVETPLPEPVETVEVIPTRAVVVAARPLPRGTRIQKSDIRTELRPEPADGLLGSADLVIGQETTRFVSQGKAFDGRSVEPPILVRRGDALTVYARGGGVVVRSVAKAREPGSLGALILVEPPDRGKRYFARVCGVQEVEVYARARQAAPVRLFKN